MRYLAPAILWCISAAAQLPVPPPAAGSIEGTVVNAAKGEPVKKVRLFLQRVSSGRGVHYATTTDSSGHFLIDEVDAGRYTLWAYRNGFPDQTYSPYGGRRQHATILELAAGQDLKELVFKLVPNAVITGRVLDEDGDPLAGASVDCMKAAYDHGQRQFSPQGSSTTNEDGEFRLVVEWVRKCAIKATGPPPNQYPAAEERPVAAARARAHAGDQKYMATYYPNTANPNVASILDVPAGAQITGINMTLLRSRTVQIKGHVTSPAECPFPSDVALTSVAGYWSMPVRTDSQARFQINGVLPGPYSLQAQCGLDDKPYFALMPIEVRDENLEGIELTLQPIPNIQGRVILEGNLKGSSPLLEIQTRLGVHETIRLRDDLTFDKNLLIAPGLFGFSAEGLPRNAYVKSVHLGQSDITDTGFDVMPGVLPEPLTIVLSPNAGVIEGSVKNAQDEPAGGALITLIPDAGHRGLMRRYKTSSTDQNGHFTIQGVIPGEYKIYAWEDLEGDAYQDPGFMQPHEADGVDVSIKESAHETVQLKVIPAETTGQDKPDR